MKITFEGHFNDILKEMARLLTEHAPKATYEIMPEGTVTAVQEMQGPGPDAKPLDELLNDPPVDKPEAPVEKPVDKMAKVRAAKKAKAPKAAVPEEPADEDIFKEPMDPAEVVKVRQKTIEDLQAAYAGGHQKEVFELLSRFGNGAKSFRELPPDAFMPIREAIDKGALT